MSNAMLRIPRRPEEVTAEWLTEALSTRYEGVEVTSVRRAGLKVSAAAKLRIEVEYNGAGRTAGLPSAICVKASFDNETLARIEGERTAWDDLYTSEGRFYAEVAPALDQGINIPACYYAAVEDGPPARSIMLLEDLVAVDARFGSFDRPLSADQVAAALDELAAVHAAWWQSPRLAEPWLDNPLVQMLEFWLTPDQWQREVVARPRWAQVPEPLRDFTLVADAVRKTNRYLDKGPMCLVHGDPHIGNLFFRPGEGPGWLDWQVACRGPWAFDVEYFVVGAMTIEDRREHQLELLRHYLEALRSAGVEAPSLEDGWREFRRWHFHGFMNFFTPGEEIQTEEYNGTVGERFGVAIVDNGTLAVLAEE